MTAASITNQNQQNNMENFSEKKKRGRPQSWRREFADRLAKNSPWDHMSTRHKINMSYVAEIQWAMDDDAERAIWGGTLVEVGCWPKGFPTAATEAGKWAEAIGGEDKHIGAAVDVMSQARKDGVSFGDIAEHFKRLRLGEKSGDATDLTMILTKAIDEYRKTFPNITQQQMINAAEDLRDFLIEHFKEAQNQPTPTNQ